MKKFLIILSALLVLTSLPVGAVKPGDKITEAVYSDLTAYINNYPISSYVVNDYAVIVAEDLRNYGCDVTYDNTARSLSITRSASSTIQPPAIMYKTAMPTGAYFKDVLYTDIKTYVNGNEITSFNVNGETMIVIDQFGEFMDGYNWDQENRAAQAWISGKDKATYKPLAKRTEELFSNPYDYSSYESYTPAYQYSGWWDFNFDGGQEQVEISIIDDLKMFIRIGAYTRTIDICDATLDNVYICDIDTTDGVKDLAIITTQVSADPVINIVRYDPDLTEYQFAYYDYYDGRRYVDYGHWLGYVDNYEFRINDDGSITLKEQTDSIGMWHVYKTYYRDSAGVFEESVPAYYEVLPDKTLSCLEFDNSIYGYEKAMLEKGYLKAHTTYYGGGITLMPGDYFKVLYDNGNNSIYIVKENGHGGWITIDYTTYSLNPAYFSVAG